MNKQMTVLLLIAIAAGANYASAKEINFDVTFKNLYAKRDFDAAYRASIGSWSQGVIARVNGQHEFSDETALLYTGSLQYAQRLSEDKHSNDMIMPFDTHLQEQASEYKKIAGSIGLKHKQHQISWGEQWVDTPLATTDYSRQLLTIYQGWLYSGQLNPQLKVDLGYLDKFSPRNEEKFRKITVNNQESDGLTYLDLKFKTLQGNLQTQIFLSELEDLYNQYSLGLQYKTQVGDLRFKSKFRYYYTA